MVSKTFSEAIAVGHAVLTVVLGSAALLSQVLLSQTTPAANSFPAGLEFPVNMRQTVAAGKTPVGTKVQAKLTVATLVGGVVVPQDAILSGEVTESVAKSATNPSRLAIRMDSAQWTNGSAPIKVYLTAWYYPVATPADQYRRIMPGICRLTYRPALMAAGARRDVGWLGLPPPPTRRNRLHRHFQALTRAPRRRQTFPNTAF